MQKSVYYCDHCKKVIGNVTHISLVIRPDFSGIAVPPTNLIEGWRVKSKISGFMHFHVKCIGPYFEKLESEAVKNRL
jgi:hypothetical protein